MSTDTKFTPYDFDSGPVQDKVFPRQRCSRLTSLANVTKPKPLLLLDCLSCITTESMTSPNCSKNGVNSLTVTVHFPICESKKWQGSKTRIFRGHEEDSQKEKIPGVNSEIGFSSWIQMCPMVQSAEGVVRHQRG